MKVYTEVVYAWDDNKGELVEESSKSFDYEGEVTLCDRRTRRVGNRYTGYYNISVPHGHTPKVKIELPKIKFPDPPKIDLPGIVTDISEGIKGAGSGITTGIADASSGITTTLSDASGALQTNLEGAASGLKEGAASGTSAVRAGVHAAASAGKTNLAYGADAGKAFLHEGADFLKAGWDKLRGKKPSDPGSSTTVGSTSAPGQSATMGQGGKDLMKGATLAFTRKTTVGSGGKRRLRKISRSGARV